jgi:hypothetical protein
MSGKQQLKKNQDTASFYTNNTSLSNTFFYFDKEKIYNIKLS